MAEMRLIVSGAAGRMGRMVVRTIHESDGLKLTGALERPDSPWLGNDPALLAGCAREQPCDRRRPAAASA